MADDWRKRWGQKVAKMFPGDVIHSVAPTSKDAPSGVRIAAKDEAALRKMRKLERRAARARGEKA